MLLTYVGKSDIRSLNQRDIDQLVGPDKYEIAEDWVWTPNSTLEVPDDVGEALVEVDREFRNPADTYRDLRSKEELVDRAKELQITGRTKMNREELLEAIALAEIEAEAADAGDESTSDQGSDASKPEES